MFSNQSFEAHKIFILLLRYFRRFYLILIYTAPIQTASLDFRLNIAYSVICGGKGRGLIEVDAARMLMFGLKLIWCPNYARAICNAIYMVGCLWMLKIRRQRAQWIYLQFLFEKTKDK